MTRALVVGATGQLGRALIERLGKRAISAGGRERLDVRDAGAVARVVEQAAPEVVFNASAYNKVDAAESEPAEAMAVNALGPLHLARACHRLGALLVHVSTDYVFDGAALDPIPEEACPRPLSVYGVSKLTGEHLVTASGAACLVVRTSGVFALGGSRDKGGSFVERILARARAGEQLRVVNDQVFSPTYAPDLAAGLIALVEADARGLFHVVNDGTCSWHELAVAALHEAGLQAPVEPIASVELKLAAVRPRHSVLGTERYKALGLPPLRSWREALKEMLSRG